MSTRLSLTLVVVGTLAVLLAPTPFDLVGFVLAAAGVVVILGNMEDWP